MQLNKYHNHEIVIKPCNSLQLAKAYGVSKKVLLKWLQPYRCQLGKRNGHKFSLEQLLNIIDLIGMPLKSIA